MTLLTLTPRLPAEPTVGDDEALTQAQPSPARERFRRRFNATRAAHPASLRHPPAPSALPPTEGRLATSQGVGGRAGSEETGRMKVAGMEQMCKPPPHIFILIIGQLGAIYLKTSPWVLLKLFLLGKKIVSPSVFLLPGSTHNNEGCCDFCSGQGRL